MTNMHEDQENIRQGVSVSVSVRVRQKKPRLRLFLLTHLGSNQDSAEPKSVVLPITPWVSVTL